MSQIRGLIGILVKKWIPIFIATLTGLFVLVGYLVPNSLWAYYRNYLVEWAVIVAAFAFALGMVNLARVHGGRVIRLRQGWGYSLALLLAMLIGALPPFLEISQWFMSGSQQTQETLDQVYKALNYVIFDCVISPLGASLAALVAFTLVLAAFQMLRTRRGWKEILQGWGFILIVAFVLLISVPLVGLDGALLADIRREIVSVLGMAGMRGLLLGVALGTIITGLRILLASDRPHSEF